jgi:hypothetical protein
MADYTLIFKMLRSHTSAVYIFFLLSQGIPVYPRLALTQDPLPHPHKFCDYRGAQPHWADKFNF